MTKRVTPSVVHDWLEDYLSARAELGLRKAMTSVFLEPQNPFDPQAHRKARKEVLVAALLASAAPACFLYFNVIG